MWRGRPGQASACDSTHCDWTHHPAPSSVSLRVLCGEKSPSRSPNVCGITRRNASSFCNSCARPVDNRARTSSHFVYAVPFPPELACSRGSQRGFCKCCFAHLHRHRAAALFLNCTKNIELTTDHSSSYIQFRLHTKTEFALAAKVGEGKCVKTRIAERHQCDRSAAKAT